MQDCQAESYFLLGYSFWHFMQRQVCGDQSDTQTGCSQHHHDFGCSGALGQKLRMAAETDTCFIDDAFLYRAGDQARECTCQTAGSSLFKALQHIASIGFAEPPRSCLFSKRNVDEVEDAGLCWVRLGCGVELSDFDVLAQL